MKLCKVIANLGMRSFFFVDVGSLIPLHSSHHLKAATGCLSSGSTSSAPGLSLTTSVTTATSLASSKTPVPVPL